MKLKVESKFLLTGTPVENKNKDLLNLYDFILPNFLNKFFCSNQELFDIRWLECRFFKKKSFFMLRRLKKDVLKCLPLKREFTIRLKLTLFQKYMYNKIVADLQTSHISKDNNIFKKLMLLRKVCVEPRLDSPYLEMHRTIKFEITLFILRLSIFLKKKLIIFSQFVSFLQIMQCYLNKMNVSYLSISGSVINKTEVCLKFNVDSRYNVLLVSTKSGSLGFNINEADLIIHYDP
jgi:SNF2 family DNA or RNA helicase